jgi:hypothetical protein
MISVKGKATVSFNTISGKFDVVQDSILIESYSCIELANHKAQYQNEVSNHESNVSKTKQSGKSNLRLQSYKI